MKYLGSLAAALALALTSSAALAQNRGDGAQGIISMDEGQTIFMDRGAPEERDPTRDAEAGGAPDPKTPRGPRADRILAMGDGDLI